MKHIVFILGLLLLFGCDGTDNLDNNAAKLSFLDGNDFLFEIDRISETPDVQFPLDDLQESDYEELSEGTHYNVIISQDGQIVAIEPGSMRGRKISNEDNSVFYQLDEGVFAGGRFVIWINYDRFETELTVYGSGVPIVKSERGYLVLTP